ncbi:MAG: Vancomycin B-type resistance protein VanW [Pelotomaculum sp. PtaB.Bin104]|nr:MAG: Vancomycin B-type resistance protein VanW [Pelotomaculum sp. PtaB.Bin104]
MKIFTAFCFFILAFIIPASAQNNIDPQKTNNEFDPFMTGVLLSGPVTEVPWENDSDFLSAKEQNDCPILMAAYKTVLKDPLPGEEYNVHLAAKYISGTVIAPNQVFSQNKKAGPYTAARGYQKGPTYLGTTVSTTIGGGVCKISSTLFNDVILSDLEVVERYTHRMPVPYVPYGQDATVSYGAKDFKFRNNTEASVMIWAEGVENTLFIGIYGKTVPPKVVWNHNVLKVFKFPIISTKNYALPPNTEVIHEGMDGALIESSITLIYPDGTVKTKELGKSYYDPLPYIKEISG